MVECPVRVDAIEPVLVSSWAGGPGCGGGLDGVVLGVAGVGGYPGSDCRCSGVSVVLRLLVLSLAAWPAL